MAREVIGLSVAIGPGPDPEAADEIGPPRRRNLLEARVDCMQLFAIGAPPHDLHEAGIVRPASERRLDVLGFGERDVSRVALLRLGPPAALLRALAVGLGSCGGFETSERDPVAVVGHAGRRSE